MISYLCKLTLLAGILFYATCTQAQVKTLETADGFWILENRDSVLFYQKTSNSIHGACARSNYVHPLYSLNGTVLTEDFPEDHPHQRGIFWAWHQLYVDTLRVADGWDIQNISWQVVQIQTEKYTDYSQSISTQVNWLSPLWQDSDGQLQPFITEQTEIRVYPRKANYRIIDFTINLQAMENQVSIGGSENEKGYGGFSVRMCLADQMTFTGQNGLITPTNLPVNAGPWVDISGPLERDGSLAGITIVNHPSNSPNPNPWILRTKDSMQNAVFPYPGKLPIPLSPHAPLTLQYRLIVHDGTISGTEIEQIRADFAD